jgi:FKBP-type peptidyl-prolyl cis-trans isomerase 2
MERYLAFGIILALLAAGFGCIGGGPSGQENLTNNSTLAAQKVAYGDRVLVDYILYVKDANGSIGLYDTSMQDMAVAGGIFHANLTYKPVIIDVSQNSTGVIPGFIRGMIGMESGTNKTFDLAPSDAYGDYDPGKVSQIAVEYNSSRVEGIPLAYFEMQNLSIVPGTNISTAFWPAEVVNSTNSTVYVKYFPEINQTFTFNGLTQRIKSFDEQNILVSVDIVAGGKYVMKSADGKNMPAFVESINGTVATINFNHPLAGKSLEFVVFVRAVQKGTG